MEETELIRRMKAGDPAAFDALYERYSKSLFRTACLICGNPDDAEDVLQETFVTCVLHIGELRREESFRYWIFRILTRHARKLVREKGFSIPTSEIEEEADRSQVLLGDAGSGIDGLLERRVLEDALAALSPGQREVIVLYYYQDMSVREIASVLRIFEGTVKSRLHAGRKVLKSALQDAEEGKNGK